MAHNLIGSVKDSIANLQFSFGSSNGGLKGNLTIFKRPKELKTKFRPNKTEVYIKISRKN